ncbi:MAG: DNA polymerase I [Planctomyces sp.]
MARDCLYLIDTFSLMFQVFHAIPPMTGTRGQPTNAVFGITRDLLAILDRQPTHLICALDSPGPGTRELIYPQYKANRADIPADLKPQIPLIKQLIAGFNIPGIELEGWEADDIIATATRQALELNMDVVIVSSDKDNRQLLGPHVRMFNCRRNEFYDSDSLLQDWGIRPDQVIDFQSLVGDSVDNVPGVPKVGPKTATTLLSTFQTLDAVFENIPSAGGKALQKNLTEGRELAYISRQLVTLRQDLPLQIDFTAARISPPDHNTLLPFFQDMGFRGYTAQMKKLAAAAGDSPGNTAATQAPGGPKTTRRTPSLFDSPQKNNSSTTPPASDNPGGHNTGLTAEPASASGTLDDTTAPAVLQQLQLAPVVILEPVCSGSTVRQRQLTAAAISDGQSFWLLHTPAHSSLHSQLLQFLATYPGELCLASAKPLCHALLNAGCGLPARLFDASIADYLVDAGARGHELADIADRYAPDSGQAAPTAAPRKPRQQTMFAEADDTAAPDAPGTPDAASAAAQGLQTLLAILPGLRDALHSAGLQDLYRNLEEPLIRILATMEHAGITVDAAELQRQSRAAGTTIEKLTADIFAIAGHQFNIDSPKQLGQVLFTELKLPVIRKTQTGASTDQEVLEELSAQHPLPKQILERRHLIKLQGTYLDALPKLVSPQTGRIHATFHQTVAATGRLSSSDPNLQNIPVRTPEGRQVRAAFQPADPQWTLVCADYSQIELRVLAHFSGDQAMCEAFQAGIDIHAAVAADVFQVPVETVSPDQRRMAKAVNFGVIYGQTPWGLAASLGIDKAEAAAFIDDYFRRYAGVAAFCERILEETARTGYARTILNRRRAISGIRRTTGINRNMPERTAINTVIQGSAADLIKQAMLNVDRMLRQHSGQTRLLLQIHDELVLECPQNEAADLIPRLRQSMQDAMTLNVPLIVDITTGPDWLNQQDI